MNYKAGIIRYVGLAGIFAIVWYLLERNYLYSHKGFDLLFLITGTHGGYGYFLMIASVFMVVFLQLAEEAINPFSIIRVSRLGRRELFKKNFFELIKTGLIYTFIYVGVQLVYVLVYIDFERLIETGYFGVIVMYYIAVCSVFCFGGMCYMLLNVIFRKHILSMIVTVAIHMGLAYFLNGELLYGGLRVIDKMNAFISLDSLIWLINQLINWCMIGILSILSGAIYDKRDIL